MRAQAEWAAAVRALDAAERARMDAVWRARETMSLADVAGALGLSRARVVQLARAGRERAGGAD